MLYLPCVWQGYFVEVVKDRSQNVVMLSHATRVQLPSPLLISTDLTPHQHPSTPLSESQHSFLRMSPTQLQ